MPLFPTYRAAGAAVLLLSLLAPDAVCAQKIDVRRYIDNETVLSYHMRSNAPGLFVRVRANGEVRLRFVPEPQLEEPVVSLAGASDFIDADFARRTGSIPRFDEGDTWVVRADSARDEHFDLYAVQPGGGLRRLTSSGKVDAFFPFHGRVLYAQRYGRREPYGNCLFLLDIATRRSKTIVCNEARRALSASSVFWRPDGKAFLAGGRLFRVVGDSAVQDVILGQGLVIGWTDTLTVRHVARQRRLRNVFDLDLSTGKATRITSFDSEVRLSGDARIIDGRWIVFAHEDNTTTAYDLTTSRRLGSITLPPGTSVLEYSGRYWLLANDDASRPTQWSLLRAAAAGDSVAFTVKPLPGSERLPMECDIERVSYDSFDRTLDALLYTPKRRAADLGIVIAYYGGQNEYNALPSLWCQAGVATLSPSIDRDTNGDRGGDEIVDAMYGAKWLKQRLGVSERQIGTYGMSQGGYNAMRLMTFQPSTNRRNAGFDFGFGIAEAGYSSMLTIFGNTNTESPMIIATGNPATAAGRARLRERSPLDQVRLLRAPLLLIHGTNDSRVHIRESRQMLRAARAAGKDVTLVELPGEGHGVVREENLLVYFRAQLDFLERVRKSRARS